MSLFVLDLLAVLHVQHAWRSTIVSILAVGNVADSHPHADKHQGKHKVFEKDSIHSKFDQNKLKPNGKPKDHVGDVFNYHEVTDYYDISAILSAVCVFKS